MSIGFIWLWLVLYRSRRDSETRVGAGMEGQDLFDWNQSYSGDAMDYEAPDAGMLEIIDGLRPGRALDVGCGAGGLVAALAQRGWRVTGIDIAAKAIKAAREITRGRGIEAELQVADATTWKPSTHYDLTTSSFALPGRKKEREPLYLTVRESLAPGGTVLLKDFDSTMKRVRFFAELDLVTLEELKAAFTGFSVIRAEIVETPVHDHSRVELQETGHWSAVLLHAQKL